MANPVDPKTGTLLETGASMVQNFAPVKQICAHLNAFHVYASDPTRCVESNHYCTHLTEDIRQCLIYDAHTPNAKLIGVEYMISPRLFETLPSSERQNWHSHVYEVKSGMLVMPAPPGTPKSIWNAAEKAEMKDLILVYGKTYHFWQVDRGDTVPMGPPELMGAFNSDASVKKANSSGLKGLLAERDARFNINHGEKAEQREDIAVPTLHPDADALMRNEIKNTA